MPSQTNNVENLREWFRTCPAIQNGKYFGVNYLAEKPVQYSIFNLPSTISYHENILGEVVPDDIQEEEYVFASQESYGSDVSENLDTLGFYQEVIAWIQQQTQLQNFPEWEYGIVISIIPDLSVYVADASASEAKYQIQIKIKYRRKS